MSVTLKKVKGSLERVFEKNLQDLVRGIRSNKDNEAKYISSCMEEIKQELRQENSAVKANAVAKLIYLNMLGYDISWAAFNIIEVMSSPKFTFKRIGYMAAAQSFHEGTDVLMLTTNMIRKDINSVSQYEAGVAMAGLACFTSPDIARDLANDLMSLMASTRPYIRKKAVLLMYKIFLKFPDALRPAFPRLKEKLEDPDPGVQSAAVNVICELARKNPRNYLSLAPLFFKLMTSSTNNWMLIKIIKLFGALTPLEPRLGKKLLEPLTNLIHSTSAMSLLYECINTVISVLISLSSGMPDHSASIQLCVQKLRILIEDSDQNLKYLGLLAMSKILKTHPKSVQSHKDLILDCLDDRDESIRLRALDLLYGMVSKKNLMEIVKKLMVHVDKAEGSVYRDELLAKILEICSQNNYQYIINFEWYVSILVELTKIEGTKHGHLIASQMLDVAIRVKAIRPFAARQMATLLENTHLLIGTAAQRNGICEVLYAAAWIVGEFPEYLAQPQVTLENMLKHRVTVLPGHIQGIYVQNILKLYSNILVKMEEDDSKEDVVRVTQLLIEKLPSFAESADLEVQERACCILQLLKYVNKLLEKDECVATELADLFVGELNPVAPKAQKKVPVPEGLDLDKWINAPPSDSSDEEVTIDTMFIHDAHRVKHQKEVVYEVLDEEELEKRREARRVEQASNPHYLKDDRSSSSKKKKLKDLAAENDGTNSIPVAQIDLTVPLHVPDQYMEQSKPSSKKKHRKHKRGKRGRHTSVSSDDIPVTHQVDIVGEEMPEGAVLSDHEEDDRAMDDPHRALDIDLERPLDERDHLPVRKHRNAPELTTTQEEAEVSKLQDKPKKKRSKEKETKKTSKDKKKKKTKSAKVEESGASAGLDLMEGETKEPAINGNAEEAPEPAPAAPKEVEPVTAPAAPAPAPAVDDLNFWLSQDTPTPQGKPAPVAQTPNPAPTTNGNVEEKSSKKHRKDKKVKKDKKKKKSASKENYEAVGEIEDISEEQTPDPVIPAMSSYRLLAENESLKLTYETRVDPKQNSQVVISVIFTNLTSSHLKALEFQVLDSLNTKLIRDAGSQHDGVKVPFQLPPEASNEGQFAFTIHAITMPQKLKGTLTYMVKDDKGSTSEKIDFKVNLPVSSYMLATPCSREHYSELLANGELSAKNSFTTPPGGVDFAITLARVCFHSHMAVVERVERTASLFSCSMKGHQVCVLLKTMDGGGVSVDGKSNDSSLLSNYLDEIKATVLES
ncbi:AP-3 complex subunit delta-1 isoform X2 [Strongylocentrotus purpuratus]|uniref:AP-3 complex subunit delta domain-containing protein n=1 Tax=Strongylocentrotus purpuratus TaxID=7668 RepID=A0A7M7PJ82_STRPU|nr:AP-3 complex subunit delta-1 isoform X2 [Strongylocentrotus purpuratus]